MKVLIFIFIFISSYTHAKEEITVGLFDGAPFGHVYKGKVKGVLKNLADKILEDHFSVKYIVLPYARVFNELKSGNIDITIMYPNEKLKQFSLPIDETFGNENLIVYKVSNPIGGLSELKDKRVAIMRGANYGEPLSSIKINPINVTNYSQSVKLLLDQRVRAIAISKAAWLHCVKKQKLDTNMFKSFKINFLRTKIWARKNLPKSYISKIKKGNQKALKSFPDKKLYHLLF